MVREWMPAIITNTFAIIILLILLVDFGQKQRRFVLKDQVVFHWMLINNILILVLDAGTWLLNRQTFPGARALNVFFTTAFYIVNPVMSLLYIFFTDLKLGVPPERRRRLLPLYCIPVAVNLVLALVSTRVPLLFNIHENNVYERGPLLSVSFLLSYVLLVLSFFRVLYYRKRILKQQGNITSPFCCQRSLFPLLIFPLIPLLGGILQIWFYGVTIVWLSPVFAMLIVFINIQNTEISTDVLTGLYNRRQADSYLQSLLQSSARFQPIGLAMLDMDNFKQINDRFGHLAGDHALRIMAGVLQSECDRDTFFSRYGGDEFVIVTKQKSEEWIHQLIERIRARLEERCRTTGTRYRLSISVGVALWNNSMQSMDDLFTTADILLYQDKAKMGRRAEDGES